MGPGLTKLPYFLQEKVASYSLFPFPRLIVTCNTAVVRCESALMKILLAHFARGCRHRHTLLVFVHCPMVSVLIYRYMYNSYLQLQNCISELHISVFDISCVNSPFTCYYNDPNVRDLCNRYLCPYVSHLYVVYMSFAC